MTEKNVLAYFKSREDAEGAAAKLKALRIEDMRIDEVGRFPGEGIDHVENPVNADFPSLGYLTLGGDFTDRNAGILAAADVSASGMSAGGGEDDTMGRNFLLTAVMSEDVHHQALRVVQESGGLV
ncbi:hypothetical protein [Paenibacillus flagellatus]|uniref:Uncharacterized protein n=1 Tax=Paenibacillus flagellatus TaxID=2211139 RepID=A0A2V5KD74_9BACL|nr:hypothetical protein [Paenibacillus flagellatus]PYI51840.1 hypothetical protein DLM86_23255 [Paenibacillus flagellatus]